LPLLAPAAPEIAQGVVPAGELPAHAGQPRDRQGTAASIGELDLAGEDSGFSPRGIAHLQLEGEARVDETEPELCLAGCDQDGGIGEKTERWGLERLTGRDAGHVIAGLLRRVRRSTHPGCGAEVVKRDLLVPANQAVGDRAR